LQRKYDGELAHVEVAGAVILAERMRGEISGHFYTPEDRAMFRAYGEWYAAITVAQWQDGSNVLLKDTFRRWDYMATLVKFFPHNMLPADVYTTWEQAERALAFGAEGICAHAWDGAWGTMHCHKVQSVYECRVASVGNTQSVGIVDAATGTPRGNVKLGGGKSDQVRVGSVIRVEAMGETDDGKLRQAQPCREWLVRV